MPELSEFDRQAAEHIRGTSVFNIEISQGYETYKKETDCEEKLIPTCEGDARVYVLRAKNLKKPAPVHIYVHGGGFVKLHGERDIMCSAKYAALIGGIVFDIDYKLAPEYKFPCAFNEIYDIVKWIFNNIEAIGGDAKNVTMSGYSAGGNLTAAVAIRANETGDFRLRKQILCYPPTDLATDPGDKPMLVLEENIPPERSRMLNAMYIGDSGNAKSPYASMVFAPDEMLKGLPEALVIVAGKDALKFEGMDYARRLYENGVKVTIKNFLNSRHGFMINCVDEWEEAQQLVIDTINGTI